MQEVGSLEDAYSTQLLLPPSPSSPIPATSLLIATLSTCLPGLLSSILLIQGSRRPSPCLVLPWLIIHVVIILGCFGSALYLILLYSLLSEERDLSLALAR